MQSYLQMDLLRKRGLHMFDAWVANFGETQRTFELAPEGKGYQVKTRFAKFFNLPELMNLFRLCADIKMPEDLNLPVPTAVRDAIKTEASVYQKEMVDGLADRAKAIRNGNVDPQADNMLKVTNEGRKLALDQRLMNPMLPDDPQSKVNLCVENVLKVWNDSKDTLGTQMIFCDMSTPKNDGEFNVYDDIKGKLISKGVPENEIIRMAYANFLDNKRDLQRDIVKKYPEKLNKTKGIIATLEKDIQLAESTKTKEFAGMTINGKTYTERKDASEALIEAIKKTGMENTGAIIGEFRGFKMQIDFIKSTGAFAINLQGALSHAVEISNSASDNITRLENELNNLTSYLENNKTILEDVEKQLETAKLEVEKPFPRLDDMRSMERRLNELNRELSIDNNDEAEHTAEKDEPDIDVPELDEDEYECEHVSGYDR